MKRKGREGRRVEGEGAGVKDMKGRDIEEKGECEMEG